MTEWSLSVLLAGLHDDIQRKLETVRQSFGHSTTKHDSFQGIEWSSCPRSGWRGKLPRRDARKGRSGFL
jgi:hypothetical protein